LNLVPVASMAIAAFSDAPPNRAQLLGGALVISSVTFSALSRRSDVERAPGKLRVCTPPLAGTCTTTAAMDSERRKDNPLVTVHGIARNRFGPNTQKHRETRW
jgi:hypothetical protein